MRRLHELGRPQPHDLASSAAACARRGHPRRQPQRRREHQLRSCLVALTRWTAQRGWTLPETAQRLRLAPRTLRQWQYDLQQATLQAHCLGRPVLRSSRHDRNDVLTLLHELGPATGVPTLQACFPAMPRVELADLVRRYRRLWRRRCRRLLHVLRWTTPGAVWAADFAKAPHLIDALYPYLFAVRDLASGRQLLWLPVPAPTAEVAAAALRGLFACHGAPLVVKTDNGSAFGAGATLDLLTAHEVIALFSPPALPRYNGAIEAGIGSLKTRTQTHAARHDRPWTSDDVALAQAEANATARPHGPAAPTPDQAWLDRRPLTPSDRRLFQAALARHRTEARIEQDLPTDGPLPTATQRNLDRRAIRRALVEHGYLLFRRRRITLPITNHKAADIT